MTVPPLDLTPCPGCGFSQSGICMDCVHCLIRHPRGFLKAVADMAAELDELRPIRVAAERWFRSIEMTGTPEESALALALTRRDPGLTKGTR